MPCPKSPQCFIIRCWREFSKNLLEIFESSPDQSHWSAALIQCPVDYPMLKSSQLQALTSFLVDCLALSPLHQNIVLDHPNWVLIPAFDLLICCSQNDTSRSSCALDFIQLFGRAKIILFLNFFTMTLFCYNLYHLIWMVLELFGLHLWNLKGYKYSLLNLLVLILLQWVNWTPSP